MIIYFDQLAPSAVTNFKGGDGAALIFKYEDNNNRIMRITLAAHSSIGMHCHNDSSEIVYIIKGSGKALYNGEEILLKEGTCHYCPQNGCHSVINDTDEDLTFLGIVPKLV